ncbi:hypothetical protein [Lysobacter solisilvae (ex Woo and Kim 2020)]|uniref:Uncharacterized protein n=1 Tax=Agrilutibacter terrestris TaxID=2865112 RepID=A0A7H0FWS0_9GAMM|nr:hypothetical protein [Lysobacter terrestris]QNP40486.1 hypothetical protein H8B22_13600 [Lysobacter terrestris]
MPLGADKQRQLLERWPAIRARGAARFVLVRGVLMWGGLMTAFLAVMVSLQLGLHHPRLPLLLAIAVPLCAIGGAVWGALTWWINERIFRSLTSN